MYGNNPDITNLRYNEHIFQSLALRYIVVPLYRKYLIVSVGALCLHNVY